MSILLVGSEPNNMMRLKLTHKSLKSLGYDVRVFSPSERQGRFIIRYLITMIKLLFVRADVYHFFSIPDVIGLPLLLKRGKLVYDVRSPWKDVVLDTTGNKYMARVADKIERLMHKRADVVIAANPILLERALDYGCSNVTVVPNLVYESMDINGWEELRKINIKNNTDKLIVYTGKISLVEGSRILTDSIIGACSDKTLQFAIFGDGPELQNVINEVAVAGCLNQVHFYGWIPHNAIGKWVRAADLCIMPREEKGTSNYIHPDSVWKIIVAFNIGTPVLATRVGGFNDDSSDLLNLTDNVNFFSEIIRLADIYHKKGKPEKYSKHWTYSRDILREIYEMILK